eukprot:scaffold345_cov134-Cylindrotheca_fusiformis.AAC.22
MLRPSLVFVIYARQLKRILSPHCCKSPEVFRFRSKIGVGMKLNEWNRLVGEVGYQPTSRTVRRVQSVRALPPHNPKAKF